MASVKGLLERINNRIFEMRRNYNAIKYSCFSGEKTGISILSCNCTGGVLMHEYNMKYMTPTINFFMSAGDFVKFVERLDFYLDADINISNDAEDLILNYPVILLGDLKIYGVHYRNIEEFKEQWMRRKIRIRKDRLFCIFSDRDGFDDSLLPRIDAIPYRKVMFSHIKYPEYSWVCYIPGFEKEKEIVPLTEFIGLSGKKYYSKYDFKRVFAEMSGIKQG